MDFALEPDEARVLMQVLNNYLPQLRSEVYKTENYDWRQELKADEVVVKRLMERLGRLLSTEAGAAASQA